MFLLFNFQSAYSVYDFLQLWNAIQQKCGNSFIKLQSRSAVLLMHALFWILFF